MQYIVTIIVFGIFYQILFLGSFMIFYAILYGFLLRNINSEIVQNTEFLFVIILLALSCIGNYRAKIATDCRVKSSMTMRESHSSSGYILKTNLSFIPVIGKLFKNKN